MSEASAFHVYRYRLRPMREDQEMLAFQSLGNARWAYNRMVAINRDLAGSGEKPVLGTEAINLLPQWKLNHEWLGLGPSQPLQQALIDYAQAQMAHRQDPGQFGAPNFKSRDDLNASLRFPQPRVEDWNADKGWINLPKFGQLKYFKDPRKPQGTLKQVSLVREGHRWLVCLCVEQSEAVRKQQKRHDLPKHPQDLRDDQIGGIDLGHVHAATDHLGNHHDFPMRKISKIDERIAKLQAIVEHKRTAAKALAKHKIKLTEQAARTTEFAKSSTPLGCNRAKENETPTAPGCSVRLQDSNSLKQARCGLRKLKTRRRDLLTNARHQLSHHLTQTFPVLGVEDLAVKKLMENVSRSEAVKIAEADCQSATSGPGCFKSVKFKAPKKPMPRVQEKSLHRGWACLGAGVLINQLQYKAARKGGLVVKVNQAYTSQTCPNCLHIHSNNRESQAVFRCKSCGFECNADKVGAINVRTRTMETLMTQGFPIPEAPKHRHPRNPQKKKTQAA